MTASTQNTALSALLFLYREVLHQELPFQQYLTRAQRLHQNDLEKGFGAVELPYALAQKYPNAAAKWGWQHVFPAAKRSIDPRSGVERRHHMLEDGLQRAVKTVIARTGTVKHGSCHTFRHSFATHLIEAGYDIRTVQELHGLAKGFLDTALVHRQGAAAGAWSKSGGRKE